MLRSPLVNPYRCSAHPRAPAAFGCNDCERRLCPDCARAHPVARDTVYETCAHCGGPAFRLKVAASRETLARKLVQALLLPVGIAGFGVLVLDALIVAFGWPPVLSGRPGTRVLTTVEWLVAVAGFWVLALAVLRASAEDGKVSLDLREDLAGPALHGLALTGIVGVAGVALAAWRPGAQWALAFSAAAWLPAVLISLAQRAPLAEVLDPRGWVRTAAALGSDYATTVVATLGVFAFVYAMAGTSKQAEADMILLWPPFLRSLGAFALFLVPRLVGLLINVRGEALGYAFVASREVEVMPDARAPVVEPAPPPP